MGATLPPRRFRCPRLSVPGINRRIWSQPSLHEPDQVSAKRVQTGNGVAKLLRVPNDHVPLVVRHTLQVHGAHRRVHLDRAAPKNLKFRLELHPGKLPRSGKRQITASHGPDHGLSGGVRVDKPGSVNRDADGGAVRRSNASESAGLGKDTHKQISRFRRQPEVDTEIANSAAAGSDITARLLEA